MMDAATCAKVGYAALKKGKIFALAGKSKLMPFMVRIAPRRLSIKIARRQFERA
jgi:short-subunit dehydrogenase